MLPSLGLEPDLDLGKRKYTKWKLLWFGKHSLEDCLSYWVWLSCTWAFHRGFPSSSSACILTHGCAHEHVSFTKLANVALSPPQAQTWPFAIPAWILSLCLEGVIHHDKGCHIQSSTCHLSRHGLDEVCFHAVTGGTQPAAAKFGSAREKLHVKSVLYNTVRFEGFLAANVDKYIHFPLW